MNWRDVVLLIIDDERDLYELVKLVLPEVDAVWVNSGKKALQFLKKNKVDLVLLDKCFANIPEDSLLSGDPEAEGLTILTRIKENFNVPVLMITEFPDSVSVSKALSLGVDDYLEWEVLSYNPEILKKYIKQTIQFHSRGKEELFEKYYELGFVGKSNAILKIFREIERIAPRKITILITGETGTGKEKVARCIYKVGNYSGPFVAVSMPSIPKELVESELFGYKKGAFTGAEKDKSGLIEMATNGVLFLDEIGDLPLSLQPKFLRMLENSEYYPVGATEAKFSQTRIIAATNLDLEKKVKAGEFRKDLYYRLKVAHIHLPPLRERKQDIPLLIDYFIQLHSNNLKIKVMRITEEAKRYLCEADWPGNVRELENTIIFALSEADDIITLKNVVSARQKLTRANSFRFSAGDFKEFERFLKGKKLKDLEKAAIYVNLIANNWDIKKTAEILGIGVSTLYLKIKELGLKKN